MSLSTTEKFASSSAIKQIDPTRKCNAKSARDINMMGKGNSKSNYLINYAIQHYYFGSLHFSFASYALL